MIQKPVPCSHGTGFTQQSEQFSLQTFLPWIQNLSYNILKILFSFFGLLLNTCNKSSDFWIRTLHKLFTDLFQTSDDLFFWNFVYYSIVNVPKLREKRELFFYKFSKVRNQILKYCIHVLSIYFFQKCKNTFNHIGTGPQRANLKTRKNFCYFKERLRKICVIIYYQIACPK